MRALPKEKMRTIMKMIPVQITLAGEKPATVGTSSRKLPRPCTKFTKALHTAW